MKTANNRRLTKIVETSLTPKQAFLLWLEEAHRFPSVQEYFASLGNRKADFPLHRLPRQVETATREAMRGRDKEAVCKAERQAVRDVVFLFMLHQAANAEMIERSRTDALQAALLAEQIKGILEQDAVSNDMLRIMRYVWEDGAFPVDAETADAVEAAFRHDITTWREANETEVISDWIDRRFAEQGKVKLPLKAYDRRKAEEGDEEDDRPDAWRLADAPSVEELQAMFKDADAFKDFMAGTDFQYGFADVRDEEYLALWEAVETALKDLVETGAVEKGTEVALPSAPMPFFAWVRLVNNEWIDRYAVELAEWGALLREKGFDCIRADDDNNLAWDAVYPPGTDWEGDDQKEAAPDQVEAVRREAKERLAAFAGGKKVIEGREYLSFADYLAWKDRKAEPGDREEGFVIASFNAWIDANGGEGKAALAGAKVANVQSWRGLTQYVVCKDEETGTVDDAAEAAKRQERRREIIRRIRRWTTNKVEVEGPEYVRDRLRDAVFSRVLPFDDVSYKTKIADWRARVRAFVGEVYRAAEAVDILSRQYCDGRPILWKSNAEDLAHIIERLETVIDLYNRTVVFRLEAFGGRELLTGEKPKDDAHLPNEFRAGFKIDPEEIKRAVQPHVGGKVKWLINKAKAEALMAMGEHEDADALLAAYATGEETE